MGQKERLESSTSSGEASTLLDRLYIYETSQFKVRAIGYALSGVIAFSYAVLSTEVWRRPEKSVLYECLALVAFLSLLIPILQVKMMHLRLPRVTFLHLPKVKLPRLEWFISTVERKLQTAMMAVFIIILVTGAIMSAIVDMVRTLPILVR